MKVVENKSQIFENLFYLESPAIFKSRDHVSLIEKGICFVVYNSCGKAHFAPSRFIGYIGNNIIKHGRAPDKDGKDTTPAITRILGFPPLSDQALDLDYRVFCSELGFDAKDSGNFGVQRKFWDIR